LQVRVLPGPPIFSGSLYSLRHSWATLKLNAGMDVRLVALNLGTSPEMVHRHYGHDNTKSRASEFADVWLTKEEE
jgi:integrase